jgi:hypothetical protein
MCMLISGSTFCVHVCWDMGSNLSECNVFCLPGATPPAFFLFGSNDYVALWSVHENLTD